MAVKKIVEDITKSVKIPQTDLVGLMLAGLIKSVEEKALAKTPIGNGTWVSGLSKLGVGVGIDMFKMDKNMIGKASKTAFIIDGVEDIVNEVLKIVPSNFIPFSSSSDEATSSNTTIQTI